jgi:hypothetical protein
MTKSMTGAPRAANSAQLFERNSSVGSFILSSNSSAIGWTAPFGKLPAL